MNTSSSDKLLLSSWGLPPAVHNQLAKKGLTRLYPWQAACLECGAAGNNLVYCAPTSGGKSLVAEILMLARMHSMQQTIAKQRQQAMRKFQEPLPRGLLVLPYLSIVSEKTDHMSRLLADVKWRVQGYQGDTEGQPLANKAERIAICSIEKANMAINNLIQEGRLHELVSVVVDEAHMLADAHRGAALEMLLSKLMACRDKCCVQLVAMSATMAGLDSLSTWLNAHLFLTNFRPVPLTEHAVFEGTVYVKQPQALGAVAVEPENVLVESRRLPVKGKDDKWCLLALVSEVVREGHSVLIFCASRHAAQSCAAMLTRELPAFIGQPSRTQRAAREELVNQLRLALVGTINQELEHMIAAGVAYHHAGLMQQERSVVEDGYRSGALLVLTATSTLAAGVNLPARRVILRSLWQGVGEVSRAQYLQMVGRAGRAGQSAVGESFLLGKGAAGAPPGRFCEWMSVCKLMAAPLPVLTSRLVDRTPLQHPAAVVPQQQQSTPTNSDSSSVSGRARQQQSQQMAELQHDGATVQPMLQHLLLHGVATGLISTGLSVAQLLQNTLAFHQMPASDLQVAAKAALGGLRVRKLISLKADTPTRPSHWELTALGQAVVASTMPPDLGLLLHNRLEALMRDCVVLGSSAHLLYVLLPDPLFNINDWNQWHRLASDMTAQHKRIAKAEQVELSYIQRRCGGVRGDPLVEARHARFAAAMLLDLLVDDASCVMHVEKTWGKPDSLTKMGFTRGQLQSWQLEVSRTAAMAALLACNAGWWQLETLLAPLAAQAAAGVRPELLPLMQVPGIQPAHASALHAAGFVSPEILVSASESDIAAALAAKLPNMRKRKDKGKSGLDLQPGRNALVSRAAKAILAAARQHAVHSATTAADDVQEATQADATKENMVQQAQPHQHQLKPIHGQATVHQVWPKQDDPLLNQLLDGWLLQPSFSFAVVVDHQQCAVEGCRFSTQQSLVGVTPVTADTPSGSGNTALAAAAKATAVEGSPCGSLHCQKPIALVLCWTDKDAAVLQLPTASARGGPVSSRVWGTIRTVFGDAERTATCCGAAAAVAALAAVGVQCKLTVDDPCAAFMLWQPGGCEQLAHEQQQTQQQGGHTLSQLGLVMKAAHLMVLGDTYKLQIPLGSSSAQTEATRAAVLARALMPPLRALLARHQLWSLYEGVERPLQLVLADVRHNGVRVSATAVEEHLHTCRQRRQLLQQHVQQVSGGLDISSSAQVRMFLSRCRLSAAGTEHKEQPVAGLLQKGVRAAIRAKQHHMLPLLRCMLTYYLCEGFEQQLSSLLQYATTTTSSSSNGGIMHVMLQSLPSVMGAMGHISLNCLGHLSHALAQMSVPALPLAVAEISLEDQDVTALSAAASVVMLMGGPLPHQQRFQEYSGVLHSLSQVTVDVHNSQLPLHGSAEADAPIYMGCVRHWCSVTQSVREVQLPSSAIHSIPQQQSQQRYSFSFAPGTLSIAPAVQPSRPDHMFVGVQLDQLTLVVLAGVSRDPALLGALDQSDPLGAAARHWLQHGGLQPAMVELLLNHVAAGSATGIPLPPADTERALLSLAIDALVFGQKPSVQRELLGLEQRGFTLVESLWQAFPGLLAWQQAALKDCRTTGYLRSGMGRKLNFKLPATTSNPTSKDARAAREAERMACSLALLASAADVEHLAAVVLSKCCCSSSLNSSWAVCHEQQMILEVPSASALSSLKDAVLCVHNELAVTFGMQQAGSACKLPFRWWWSSALDPIAANWFTV